MTTVLSEIGFPSDIVAIKYAPHSIQGLSTPPNYCIQCSVRYEHTCDHFSLPSFSPR
jgi:hypothetical protein